MEEEEREEVKREAAEEGQEQEEEEEEEEGRWEVSRGNRAHLPPSKGAPRSAQEGRSAEVRACVRAGGRACLLA